MLLSTPRSEVCVFYESKYRRNENLDHIFLTPSKYPVESFYEVCTGSCRQRFVNCNVGSSSVFRKVILSWRLFGPSKDTSRHFCQNWGEGREFAIGTSQVDPEMLLTVPQCTQQPPQHGSHDPVPASVVLRVRSPGLEENHWDEAHAEHIPWVLNENFYIDRQSY